MQKKRLAIFLAALFAASLFGYIFQTYLEVIDSSIMLGLTYGLNLSKAADFPLLVSTPLDLLTEILLSAAALAVGFQLPALPRTFAFAQLSVAVCIVQIVLFQMTHWPGHLLGYLMSIFISGITGYGLRRANLQERKYESQYYELMLKNKELLEARIQMVRQDEVERRLLAADLHDQVLNDLKALKQKIDYYTKSADVSTIPEIENLLQQAMFEIREVMDSLCPSALEHLGLKAAIEDCCRRGGERGQFKVRFKSNDADESVLQNLSMVEQSLLYRLVQESITNICKHAQARTVRAAVSTSAEKLVISVADDGKGVDPALISQNTRGLRFMRQRADLIGATISWSSGADGKGTTVEITMSLAGKNDNSNSDR